MKLPLRKPLGRLLSNICAKCADAAANRGDWRTASQLWRVAGKLFGTDLHQARQANFLRYAAAVGARRFDLEDFRREIESYRHLRQEVFGSRKPKIAVFTTISGDYDSLKLPLVLDPRFDFFVFADGPIVDSGVYRVRTLDYCDTDKTRASRYPKMHPHVLLRGYDIAVYIDANIAVLGDIFPIVEGFLASKCAFGAIPHPRRSSLREEANACIALGKDDGTVIEEQLRRYESLSFEAEDLIECNLLMFDLRNDRLARFLETWWLQINRYSRRDQLSVNFALRQAGVSWHPLLPKGQSVRSHPAFALLAHDSNLGLAADFNAAFSRGVVDPLDGPSYSQVREERIAARQACPIDVLVYFNAGSFNVQTRMNELLESRGGSAQRIIILDDATEAGTQRFLAVLAESEPGVSVRRNDVAQGFPSAMNEGLSIASGELVLMLDGEASVSKGWAEKLADAVFSTPGAGLVAPLSEDIGDQELSFLAGLPIEDANRLCEACAVATVSPRLAVVEGPCIGVTRAAAEAVGPIDWKRFPEAPDWQRDFCFRAQRAGFISLLAVHTYLGNLAYTSLERVSKNGSESVLESVYGAEAVTRAGLSMKDNPVMQGFRARARGSLRSNYRGPQRNFDGPGAAVRMQSEAREARPDKRASA